MFIDLLNMTKGLRDENQQPSVTQELGRLFPSEVEGGEAKAESFLGLVLMNHLLQHLIQMILVLQHSLPKNRWALAFDANNSFATWSTTKGPVEEIWRSKVTSKKPQNSMSHKTTPSKFAILFHVFFLLHVFFSSDFRFAGFDNYYKITIRDRVCVPKF